MRGAEGTTFADAEGAKGGGTEVVSSVAREAARRTKGNETGSTTGGYSCECAMREGEGVGARITNTDGGDEVAGCTMLERETRKLN